MPESKSFLSRLVSELKRRNVLHVGVVYLVAAWVVVQVTSIVSTPLRLPHWTLALVIVAAIAGFPLALVVAWAFEITPEGVRRTDEAEDQQGRRPVGRASRVALVGVTAVLVAGMTWGAWDHWLRVPPVEAEAARPLDPNHVAVLYLKDIGPNHSLGYLADGLTETLIHRLGSVDGLTVVPTNGVKPFRDASVPFDSVGRLLNAGTVVDGSVQGTGDRVRVTVQLVDASTGDQLASQQLDEPLGDPFALQDTVSSEVARFLRQRLGKSVELRRAMESADDPRAWKLYQVALGLRDDANSLRWARDTAGAMALFERADSLFRVAGTLDPAWIRPPLESAWTRLTMARVGAGVTTQTDTTLLRRGLGPANQVLSRHPGNARALEVKGNLEFFIARVQLADREPTGQRTMEEAERNLRAATTRDPTRARAWAVLAYILKGQGKFAEARVAAERMAEADPYLSNDAEYLYELAALAIEFGQLDRADSLSSRGETRFPYMPAFPANKLLILASRGTDSAAPDSAWTLLDRTERLFPPGQKYQEGRYYVAATLIRAGLVDSGQAVAHRAREIDPTSPTVPHDEAYLALLLGDREGAIRDLVHYLEVVPQQRAYVAKDWWWDPLKADPRFQELVDTTRSAVR
ncbi:MAG: hypothetical protein Q8W51_14195 [Candidatus Palauibacterales bacterium]|nr:hypothetical protein [Candidatus Palauibacterales bacterium]MDP2530874.1 hypothetical protein [Candidatus Palauibacterales bacterium]MDP2582803.1 hypothetical protein [Candidatus Palauibacterales bacterium]